MTGGLDKERRPGALVKATPAEGTESPKGSPPGSPPRPGAAERALPGSGNLVDAPALAHPALSTSPVTVLAIVADDVARELFPRVVVRDRLFLTADLGEALAVARSNPPDAAFVEIGSGAGLATVHHLKSVAPEVTIFALASRDGIEAAANAVALGGSGLMMLPIGGDEILSSIESVRMRLHDQARRADLEQTARRAARAAGWMSRVAELADCPSRAAAAAELGAVLVEATGAVGFAVYLAASDRSVELLRVASSPELAGAPAFGLTADLLDHARRERLLAVPLATRSLQVGHVWLAPSPNGPASRFEGGSPRAADGLVKLLATQGAAALAFLAERERSIGAPVKDPGSSAYSFAYYVDVAGRELARAHRYGRRFSLVTIALAPDAAAVMRPTEIADHVFLCARDIDVLARVDEHEFFLLMPEADGLGAHACRRRILARFVEKEPPAPSGLLLGAATFPHDGADLAQLLRVARRRAQATRSSIVHRFGEGATTLSDLLEALEWEAGSPPADDIAAPRPIALPVADVAALAAAVIADALRGGAVLVTVAHHAGVRLGAAVRSALGPLRANVTFHALDVHAASGQDIEALSVIAEHGCYALLGRTQDGVIKGFHASDPLLADVLADRLGRAAGLRIFA